jgi:hypothetical protein
MSGISANIATPEFKFCKNRLRRGDEMETENELRKKLANVETGLANLTEPLARRGAKARAGGGCFYISRFRSEFHNPGQRQNTSAAATERPFPTTNTRMSSLIEPTGYIGLP